MNSQLGLYIQTQSVWKNRLMWLQRVTCVDTYFCFILDLFINAVNDDIWQEQ